MPSKHAKDPELLAQVELILEKKITRTQAAESMGITISSLNSRLASSGLNKQLKHVRRFVNSIPDRDADYVEAVQYALRYGATASNKKFSGLSYQVLCRKVREYKADHPTTPTKPPTKPPTPP